MKIIALFFVFPRLRGSVESFSKLRLRSLKCLVVSKQAECGENHDNVNLRLN